MTRAALSFDVEDWFHVENLRGVVARDTWDDRELRVERNVERILEILAARGTRATFFVLGWVAEKRPAVVRMIAAHGHEVACHGYGHELLYRMSPDEIRTDIGRAMGLLEDLTGEQVRGYRAPSFSITDAAVDVLAELGLEYDSSVFPTVAHDRYGRLADMPGEPIVWVRPELAEICLSVLDVGGRGLPWAGGGYFRLIPYPVLKQGIAHILASGAPYVFYLHPWEIDPGQPRVDALPLVPRFRHYVNLGRTETRLRSLVSDFEWTTLSDLMAAWRATT
jgi:polysaccharide deacetylase family protein (PEP-CTERM system associated)